MMGDDTHVPFRCPAQECQHDQVYLGVGDAKRFYLHWQATHKPRCPRTDCKYSVQDLGKTTGSYFLRHWATHLPELKTGKSACGKCGREFANANNRDRHALKCDGGTSVTDMSSTETTGLDLEHNFGTNPIEAVAPDFDSNEWLGVVAAPDLVNDVLHRADSSLLEDFSTSEWQPVEPPNEPTFVFPEGNAQLTGLFANFENDYNIFEQVIASSLPQSPPPGNIAQPVLELPQHAPEQYCSGSSADQGSVTHLGWPMETSNHLHPGSRKRVMEDATTHISKRHQCVIGIDDSPNVSESTMLQGTSTDVAKATIPQSSLYTRELTHTTNDIDAPMISTRLTTTPPPRLLKRYVRLEQSHCIEHPSKSGQVNIHRQVVAVKAFLPSTNGLREVAYDHYTWIRKLKRKPRKTTDTTSLLVNDILHSKKTRYPRIIDDNSAIFELCATGSYDEVNRLLSLGKATIVDVNSRGQTLLHVAASYWQLNVCRLLLAKGADLEARDWVWQGHTPLTLACFDYRHEKTAYPNFSSNDLSDILRLLVESGSDIHTSVEIDADLLLLAARLRIDLETRSTKFEIVRAFSWLMRRYMWTVTCNRLLAPTELPRGVYQALWHSSVWDTDTDLTEFWNQDRPVCPVLTPKDSQIFQSLWLHAIEKSTDYGGFYEFSPQFCQLYTGDFHYRQLWDVGGLSTNASPMELALRSFDALRTLHSLLLTSGTDIVRFTETECTMPWCTYTQDTLMEFFSLRPQEYIRFSPLLPSKCVCRNCLVDFQNEGTIGWEQVVDLVRSGRSLRSILEYTSEEEEERLDLSMHCCQSCILDRETFGESGDSRTDWEEDTDEEMDFVDSEFDEDSRSDARISGMEDDQMEGGADAHSDGESSSESSSDEASDGDSN